MNNKFEQSIVLNQIQTTKMQIDGLKADPTQENLRIAGVLQGRVNRLEYELEVLRLADLSIPLNYEPVRLINGKLV